jgi:hypothetical protein
MIGYIGILKRLAPYFIAVFLFFGWTYASYHHGVSTTTDKYEARLAQIAKENADNVIALQAQARIKEQVAGSMQAAADIAHQEKLNHETSSRDDVIASLNADAIKLRKRFTCSSTDKRVRSAATSIGVSDAGQTGGLHNQDAEFLIREASRANEVVLQLQQCQAVVRSDRGIK